MNELDKLINEIRETLSHELPEKYMPYYDKFCEFERKELLRASYDILDQLCRLADWHPSAKLLNLIDRYKIVF